MKRKLVYLVLLAVAFSACKKNQAKKTALQGKCIIQQETLNFRGTTTTWEYTYNKDGNVALMKLFSGNAYRAVLDSIVVSSYKTEAYQPSSLATGLDQIVTAYDESFIDLRLEHCDMSFSFADGNGLHNYYSYFFSYDSKNRLIKVQKQTNIVGGGGYELTIDYNDQDNATQLSYVLTTGSRDIIRVIATAYDDKVNPYAALKYWPLIMPLSWDGPEFESIFKALSKNNLLGFKFQDATTTITYEYNDAGFPIKKDFINTNSSGTSTSQSSYAYLCQ